MILYKRLFLIISCVSLCFALTESTYATHHHIPKNSGNIREDIDFAYSTLTNGWYDEESGNYTVEFSITKISDFSSSSSIIRGFTCLDVRFDEHIISYVLRSDDFTYKGTDCFGNPLYYGRVVIDRKYIPENTMLGCKIVEVSGVMPLNRVCISGFWDVCGLPFTPCTLHQPQRAE